MVFAYVASLARDRVAIVELAEDPTKWTSIVKVPFMLVDVRVPWALALAKMREDGLTEDGTALKQPDGEASLLDVEKIVRDRARKWRSTFSLMTTWKQYAVHTTIDVIMREHFKAGGAGPRSPRAAVGEVVVADLEEGEAPLLVERLAKRAKVATPKVVVAAARGEEDLKSLLSRAGLRTLIIATFAPPV